MENNTFEYEHIPAEKFTFVQRDTVIRDTKFQTKSRGYMADALIRFKKNKSSVVAAWIIGFLVLFALVSPLISPYSIKDKDVRYQNYPPFVKAIADMNIGILNGSKTIDNRTETQMQALRAIAKETGMDPLLSAKAVEKVTQEMYRGQLIGRFLESYGDGTLTREQELGRRFGLEALLETAGGKG